MALAVKHAEKPDTKAKSRSAQSADAGASLQYQAGFGNQFLSEAVAFTRIPAATRRMAAARALCRANFRHVIHYRSG